MPEPLGPDHSLYEHRPFAVESSPTLPHGARVAVVLFLYLEELQTGAPLSPGYDTRMATLFSRAGSTVRGEALYDYGNNVGLARILPTLDRFGVPVTVPTNAVMFDTHPHLVSGMVDRGYEIAAHGTSASTMLSSLMTEDQERDEIELSLDLAAEALGERPRGWLSQAYGQSPRTLALLDDAGLDYVADYSNDDVPYMTWSGRGLVSIPNQTQWDDVQMMAMRLVSPSAWRDTAIRAFEQLHREGSDSPRFFGLHIHPWISAMPHRIRFLEEILSAVLDRDEVWVTTAGDLARLSREQFVS
jgi:allantoinase